MFYFSFSDGHRSPLTNKVLTSTLDDGREILKDAAKLAKRGNRTANLAVYDKAGNYVTTIYRNNIQQVRVDLEPLGCYLEHEAKCNIQELNAVVKREFDLNNKQKFNQ